MILGKVSINGKVSVEEIRAMAALSQKDFSAEIGIPYSTYVKKERGESGFLASEISRISIRFGVPMDKIVV